MRDLSKPLAPTYGDPVKKKKEKKSVNKYHKGEPPINKYIRGIRKHGSKLSKFVGGTGLTVAETKAAAKDKALNKKAKAKQRNPKPGPYQY
jgi:hypothetical protein